VARRKRIQQLVAALIGCLVAPFPALGQADLDCVIEASEIAEVSSSVNGIMAKVLVDRGDWVKKGQVIAELEATVEQATVVLARAQAESKTSIGAHEARVELARKEMQRVRELLSSQSVAARLLDESETDLVVAELALDQAYEDRRIAALQLDRAEADLNLRTIKSPVSGVVVRVYTSASESVEDRPIMQIAQIDPLYVEAIAPVERFGAIRDGMVLQVYPEQPIGGQLTATVSLVERVIDASSGTFGIRLELQNPEGKIPAGLRCRLGFAD
jgi:RND family efflux transporter MFP subunit